jgi:hypothetical protein
MEENRFENRVCLQNENTEQFQLDRRTKEHTGRLSSLKDV